MKKFLLMNQNYIKDRSDFQLLNNTAPLHNENYIDSLEKFEREDRYNKLKYNEYQKEKKIYQDDFDRRKVI